MVGVDVGCARPGVAGTPWEAAKGSLGPSWTWGQHSMSPGGAGDSGSERSTRWDPPLEGLGPSWAAGVPPNQVALDPAGLWLPHPGRYSGWRQVAPVTVSAQLRPGCGVYTELADLHPSRVEAMPCPGGLAGTPPPVLPTLSHIPCG